MLPLVQRLLRESGFDARPVRALGAGDRFSLFTFPGDHNFPPVAKRMAFARLDRWLGHTPAIPTIWPGTAA